MVCKVYFRRFVALLLCCVLVWSSFVESAYATDPVTAASLAITGGQLAGAGLSGEAALSLAGPVGAVVGITLGALGVNAYVSKASQEAGKTRTRFVLDKLVLWGAQAGYTQEQLYSKIAQGISVAADGTIQLSQDVAKNIQQFGSWLFTQDGVVVPDISVVGPAGTVSFGDYNFKLFSGTGNYIGYSTITPVREYVFAVTGGDVFLSITSSSSSQNQGIGTISFDSLTPGVTVTVSNDYNSSVETFTLDRAVTNRQGEILYFTASNYYVSSIVTNFDVSSMAPVGLRSQWYSSNYVPEISTSSAQDVFTGLPDAWSQNKDVLNPSAEDTPVVLNPDLLNPIIDSLTDGQQATMSIIDYLQALQDAWDHALDDVQTAVGTISDQLTGIQEQIAVPQDAVENPTVTNPSVTPDTTPILDPSTVDPGTVVTGLSFDLTQIFPFCIPFDIYDMLATLSATPEAPVYHVHYQGPYNIVIDFTVDLTPWDSVAAVLRTVELLAFCIGLAYVTRSMFIRS